MCLVFHAQCDSPPCNKNNAYIQKLGNNFLCLKDCFHKSFWLKSTVCLVSSMGSYGDRWLQCAWCWAWGRCCHDDFLQGAWPLTDIDGIGVLCDFCFELEEPPWRPNNRQRCEQYMVFGRADSAMRRNLQAALLIKQIPGEAVTPSSLTARERVWPFGSAHARTRPCSASQVGHALLAELGRMSGCYPRVSV